MAHSLQELEEGESYEMILKDQSVLEGINEAADYADPSFTDLITQESGHPVTLLENLDLQKEFEIKVKK